MPIDKSPEAIKARYLRTIKMEDADFDLKYYSPKLRKSVCTAFDKTPVSLLGPASNSKLFSADGNVKDFRIQQAEIYE